MCYSLFTEHSNCAGVPVESPSLMSLAVDMVHISRHFPVKHSESLKFKMPLIWNFTVSIIPVLRRFWGLDFFHQRWLFCVCNLEVTLCVYERIVWFILQIWCHFMRPDHCEFGICEMVTIPADPETACFSCLFRLYKERKHWNLWEILRRFPLTWLFLPWQ